MLKENAKIAASWCTVVKILKIREEELENGAAANVFLFFFLSFKETKVERNKTKIFKKELKKKKKMEGARKTKQTANSRSMFLCVYYVHTHTNEASGCFSYTHTHTHKQIECAFKERFGCNNGSAHHGLEKK